MVFEEKELDEGVLTGAVSELLADGERLAMMGKNIGGFAVRNTNELIYNGVRKLVDQKK